MTTTTDFAQARHFIYGNGRLLEQRVFAALYEEGDHGGAVDALLAYRNADLGFGNGLEPDKRVPSSQPLDVEIAFERLVMLGADRPDIFEPACDWLATVAADSGAVPILMPSHRDYPHASHWGQSSYPPDLNPTAAIVGHLHAMGITHPWLERATEYCFAELEHDRVPDEAHALRAVTVFLASVPDRARAEVLGERVQAAIATARFMRHHAFSDDYGVSPLDFAPTPSSFARPWFADDVIEAHLDDLKSQQDEDGGWVMHWPASSDATRCEWRAIRTLQALQVLTAYGRIV